MKTKVVTKNNAAVSVDENVGQRETIVRLVLSAALVSVLFVDTTIPHKILYVVPAIYLYTTAIINWDPVYALLRSYRATGTSSEQITQMENANAGDVGLRSDKYAVNDSHEFEGGLKKAG